MITIKLKEAIQAYKRRTKQKVTYKWLAEQTGLGESTLRMIGSDLQKNASLETIEKICRVLEIGLCDLVIFEDDPPKADDAPQSSKQNPGSSPS